MSSNTNDMFVQQRNDYGYNTDVDRYGNANDYEGFESNQLNVRAKAFTPNSFSTIPTSHASSTIPTTTNTNYSSFGRKFLSSSRNPNENSYSENVMLIHEEQQSISSNKFIIDNFVSDTKEHHYQGGSFGNSHCVSSSPFIISQSDNDRNVSHSFLNRFETTRLTGSSDCFIPNEKNTKSSLRPNALPFFQVDSKATGTDFMSTESNHYRLQHRGENNLGHYEDLSMQQSGYYSSSISPLVPTYIVPNKESNFMNDQPTAETSVDMLLNKNRSISSQPRNKNAFMNDILHCEKAYTNHLMKTTSNRPESKHLPSTIWSKTDIQATETTASPYFKNFQATPGSTRGKIPHISTSSGLQSTELHDSRPLCRFFARGACNKGINCYFRHDSSKANCTKQFIVATEKDLELQTIPNPFVIDEGIEVTFGPGACIAALNLGDSKTLLDMEDSRSIVIYNLPVSVSDYDVELRLSNHGTLTRLSVKLPDSSLKAIATATFTDAKAALSTVEALNGSTPCMWCDIPNLPTQKKSNFSTKRALENNLDVVSVRLKTTQPNVLNHKSSGTTVKVLWYAPSRIATASFCTLHDAKNVVQHCNNKKLDRRVLSVALKQTGRNRVSTYSVSIGNLCEYTSMKTLQNFIEKQANVKVTSVNFSLLPFSDRNSPRIVRDLLEQHGTLTSFEIATNEMKSDTLKRRALARFLEENDAEKACQHFKNTSKIHELGGSRLFVSRVFTLKFTFPEDTFEAIKEDVEVRLKENDMIRYSIYNNTKSKTMLISADTAIVRDELRLNLEPFVRGQIVKNDNGGSVLWNPYIASTQFNLNMERVIGVEGSKSVWCDRRRREVRVFGTEIHRKNVIAAIRKHCEDMLVETFSVPITENQYKSILQSGRTFLHKLKLVAQCKNVSVDIKNRALLVEGGEMDVKRVLIHVAKFTDDYNKVASNENMTNSDDLCPICFCLPEQPSSSRSLFPFVKLSCKHAYCNECFENWLTGVNTCEFPLTCLAQDCHTTVDLKDIGKFLKPECLSVFLRTSLDCHVRKNASSLKFCPVPTCPGIFEIKKNDSESFCSTCSLSICIQCGISHSNMSCDQYKSASIPPDRLRLKIIDEILTLRCPQCKQAFLDFDGCFAIQCSMCPCNFCGWCLTDCGTDAHPHVAKHCQNKPKSATSYFGTLEQFQEAQNKSRTKNLLNFLKDYSTEKRKSILMSLEADLADLKLNIV